MTRFLRRLILAVLILALVSYIAWDQVETRGLRRDIAAIAARGEPIATDDPEAAVLTTEQRDAARIYATAAERVHEVARERDRGSRLPARRAAGSVFGIAGRLQARSRRLPGVLPRQQRTDDGGVFYGVGSRGQMAPRAGAPRDFGIQVTVKPQSPR